VTLVGNWVIAGGGLVGLGFIVVSGCYVFVWVSIWVYGVRGGGESEYRSLFNKKCTIWVRKGLVSGFNEHLV